jgi:chemotaxis protein MotA
MATLVEHHIKEEESYYQVIRIAIVSYVARSIPQIAIEFARRAIPETERPGFSELEKIMKGKGK